MEVYLMQHGKALSEEVDPERSLSPEGENQISASGQALQKMGIGFDLIVTSPKKRARQTAEIVARTVNYPVNDIETTETLQPTVPAQQAITFLTTHEDKRRVLLAGHLPSLGEIASRLLSEASSVSIRFEMGGVCRIDMDRLQVGAGQLRWYVTPDQLRLIGE